MQLFCYWQHTLQSFGVERVATEQGFSDLVKAYSTSDRHYHTLKHINHVLRTIDTLPANITKQPQKTMIAKSYSMQIWLF